MNRVGRASENQQTISLTPGTTIWPEHDRCRSKTGPGARTISNVTLTVNGATHTVDIDPATPVLYVLRNDLGLRGPRFGCGLGQCGACTVLIDGQATRTIIAQIAEVEVNRETGHVWVKRLVCGLVINPEGLRGTIQGAMLHSLSRALHEEVQFTSVNWVSHPSLTHADTPAAIDVVLVNGDPDPDRPDLPHYGAGEAACKPLVAAVANAIYDATGVRLRRVPFRDEPVRAALRAAEAQLDLRPARHA